MPYIKQEKRPILDKIVINMKDAKIVADGDLNYLLFSYFMKHIPKNYNSIKNYLGEIAECQAEIRRRFLSDYENIKMCENGDIK